MDVDFYVDWFMERKYLVQTTDLSQIYYYVRPKYAAISKDRN